jgi:hypothetical protein
VRFKGGFMKCSLEQVWRGNEEDVEIGIWRCWVPMYKFRELRGQDECGSVSAAVWMFLLKRSDGTKDYIIKIRIVFIKFSLIDGILGVKEELYILIYKRLFKFCWSFYLFLSPGFWPKHFFLILQYLPKISKLNI